MVIGQIKLNMEAYSGYSPWA